MSDPRICESDETQESIGARIYSRLFDHLTGEREICPEPDILKEILRRNEQSRDQRDTEEGIG